jgi:flagellar export protein FliJ
MKKFIFSLEKVLGFKQQTLDVKKNEIAMLQMKLHELEKEIDDLNEKFSISNSKMMEEMRQGITQNDMAIYKMYFSTINQKVQKLLEDKIKLLEVIAQKKNELVEINSEISGLEKLKEKQLMEYMKIKQKNDELAIEEFVSQARSTAIAQ